MSFMQCQCQQRCTWMINGYVHTARRETRRKMSLNTSYSYTRIVRTPAHAADSRFFFFFFSPSATPFTASAGPSTSDALRFLLFFSPSSPASAAFLAAFA